MTWAMSPLPVTSRGRTQAASCPVAPAPSPRMRRAARSWRRLCDRDRAARSKSQDTSPGSYGALGVRAR